MAEFHPLFPPSDDDDDTETEPPDIYEILVQRKEQGKYCSAPRTFQPDELTSLAALFNEYGGGEYQLVGRDSRHIIRRRQIYILPGAPKPLFDDGATSKPETKAATPINPMAAMMGGGEGGTMGLIMMMMQQMFQQSAESSRQSMQMMMAFMQTMASGTTADKQAAQEAMNRQAERDARSSENQMKMMLELTQARQAGNSSGSEEAFFKGVEFMRHFSTQQIEQMKAAATGKKDSDFDLEGLLGTALEALQGFKAFQDLSGPGIPGMPSATEAVS